MGRISGDLNPPTNITGLYVVDSLLSGDMVALKSSLAHLLLPAICLSTGTMAIVARMTRSSMLEVVGQDYVRTARAKGLSETAVIGKHSLINALIPTMTVLGLQFGGLMGGGDHGDDLLLARCRWLCDGFDPRSRLCTDSSIYAGQCHLVQLHQPDCGPGVWINRSTNPL